MGMITERTMCQLMQAEGIEVIRHSKLHGYKRSVWGIKQGLMILVFAGATDTYFSSSFLKGQGSSLCLFKGKSYEYRHGVYPTWAPFKGEHVIKGLSKARLQAILKVFGSGAWHEKLGLKFDSSI